MTIIFTLAATRDGCDQLAALVPFAGHDKNRPVLTAVAFLAERAAATDSYALGVVPIASDPVHVASQPLAWIGDAPDAGRLDLIVDARDMKKALTTVRPARSHAAVVARLTFRTDDNTVTLEGDGAAITLPLFEGSFPNVRQLLPDGRTLEAGGYVPALSADLLGRFGLLAHVSGGRPKRSPASTAVVLVADETGRKPVEVRAEHGAVLGLLKPVRLEDDVPLARARAADAAIRKEVAG